MEFAPWLKRSHPEMMHVISAIILWLKQVIWPHLTSRKWGLAILPSEQRKDPKYLMNNADDSPISAFSLLNLRKRYKILLSKNLIIIYLQPTFPASSPLRPPYPVCIHVKIPFFSQHIIHSILSS